MYTKQALQRIRPMYARCQQAQEQLAQTLSHSQGDRRLDDTDVVRVLGGDRLSAVI